MSATPSLNGFEVVRKLGEGAYSSVYKVRRTSDGMDYAMKSIKMGSLSHKEQDNAVNEVRFLASLNSPEIIGYKEAFYDEKNGILQIIMEYCPGGDLLNKIRLLKKKNQYLDEKVIWLYILQMTRGLRKLHEMSIVHRDFKCANIMLSRDHTSLKLGDLNVSKVAKQGGLLYTQTGTPYYASPEVWRDKPYNSKSDVWSLGCVIYELITLNPPFKATDMEGLFKKVSKGSYDPIPAWYSQDLSDFLNLCLQVNSKMRMTTLELLESPLLVKRLNIAQELNLKDQDLNQYLNSQKQDLLKTLKIGKNLNSLNKILPEPQYDSTAGSTPEQTVVESHSESPPIQSSQPPQVLVERPANRKSTLVSVKDNNNSVNQISQHRKLSANLTPAKNSLLKGQAASQASIKKIVSAAAAAYPVAGRVHSQQNLPTSSVNASLNQIPSDMDLDAYEKRKPMKVLTKASRSRSIELQALMHQPSSSRLNNLNQQVSYHNNNTPIPGQSSSSGSQQILPAAGGNQSPSHYLVHSKNESTPTLPPIENKRGSIKLIAKESNNIFVPLQRPSQPIIRQSESGMYDAQSPYMGRNASQGAISHNNSYIANPSLRSRASEVLLFAGKKAL